ncbi:4Fe-4S dicluster domain-containing protein [Candidatus Thorarchaeota archaeon]|nr:MAG: 4Fe-4S dicluster domain-containing protein [Candidatus Thorarchaeota archaeon]
MVTKDTMSSLEVRNWLLDQPEGETLLRCYQCGRCTSACPVADIEPSFNPRLFLQKILLSDELIAEEQLVWNCLTCEQCEVRCPEHVKIPHILILAKVRGLMKGNVPAAALDRARNILSIGRSLEVSSPMLKTREKMGLPDLGTPPMDQIVAMLVDIGIVGKIEKAESIYGGTENE